VADGMQDPMQIRNTAAMNTLSHAKILGNLLCSARVYEMLEQILKLLKILPPKEILAKAKPDGGP
jgi:hypothetical protein